jgi:predicted ATPase
MRTLEKLTIKNFRSIREQALHLGKLNVFIGGNGAGKSNLIKIFPFVRRIVHRELGLYTGTSGGADGILYFGRKMSPSLTIEMEFSEVDLLKGYRFELIPTEQDRFIFGEEAYWIHERDQYRTRTNERSLGSGHAESKLPMQSEDIPRHIVGDLLCYQLYHFHDTSSSAPIKQTGDITDNLALNSNGSNLAAFLYYLQQKHGEHLRTIEETVRQVAPFFGGFVLQPTKENTKKIRLQWRHRGSDELWGVDTLSDGTLRFICLCALLLQPKLPSIIILDEPELGLHPAAIVILAELLESASTSVQVLVATQSVTLLNRLTPAEVIVVEREDEATVMRPLSGEDQETWMEGYSLGELWEKNVFGARP